MEGILPFKTEKINWKELEKTKTQIMVNIGNPDLALKTSMMPVAGVGLARLEFIITEYVKVHPMAILHPERVQNIQTSKEIANLIKDYKDHPEQYFIDKLAEGVAMIAAAFYPRPVTVRFSDFKTNEYSHLLGGEYFEPLEENPMIGFRGASRYYNPLYKDAFALECQALKKVRDEMGLTNVKLMVPFCRTAKEGALVIGEMAKHNLIQGHNGLEVYVMCEIPSNVLDMNSFAKVFDGFSIGSNDLAQMTLGVDRDSAILSQLFDERDPAVLTMIDLAIHNAKNCGKPIGICGQAPSDFPELVEFLIEREIDSISLSPDSVFKSISLVKSAEGKEHSTIYNLLS